jgi:mannitol-1-/sugar-/sorbitol-6-phosphatase
VTYQAVLFDMDGTIVDSSIPVIRQWRKWADANGIDFARVEAIMHGRRAIETMQMLAPQLPQPETVERFLAEEELDTEGITAIPGAADFIGTLGKWAVVTSATQSMARARMRAAGLPQPEVLVGADMVSKGKPDPECFLRAAEMIGVAPQRCLVFEDALAGIRAAQSANMRCIGLTTHYTAEQLAVPFTIPDFRNHAQLLKPLLD